MRGRQHAVRLQSPRTPIPTHSDSVVSDVAPSVSSVSSAAALNVAPDPGAATQTLAAGNNARARPTPVRRQPTGTPLSSSAASVVSDVAPSVSSATALSVAPDVLASAVSQAVGHVLQPLMERVEQLESAPAVVPPVNSSSIHALGHPLAARWSLSVPDKLRGRIERGEFIDFDDLLPDKLGVEPDVVQLAVGANRSVQLVQKPTQAQRRHVHDVASWLEVFTVYTRVIVAAAPDSANDLLAYQATILDANNLYHVDAWLSYDRRFQRHSLPTTVVQLGYHRL